MILATVAAAAAAAAVVVAAAARRMWTSRARRNTEHKKDTGCTNKGGQRKLHSPRRRQPTPRIASVRP
jgi:hypothetical protein